MYKIFTDQDKKFTCKVDVGGVSLNECKARMILESQDLNILFNGDIKTDGTCEINLHKLKDILPESSKGKLRLEIIAENTLFIPWQSDFEVAVKKKVTISEVKTEDTDIIKEEKSPISIKVDVQEEKPKPKSNLSEVKRHIRMLEKEMIKRNINTVSNFEPLFEQYSKAIRKKEILSEKELNTIKKYLIKKIK